MRAALAFVLVYLLQECSGRTLHANSTSADHKAHALIVGGKAAPVGRYPYAVYIMVNTKTSTAQCTGSLIAPRVVLTAGHCVLPGAKVLVAVGAYNRVLDDAYRRKWDLRQVVSIATYPGFDTAAQKVQNNDLALLLLDKASSKRPVKLPTATASDPVPDEPLLAIGWGAVEPDSEETSFTLKQDGQPVVSRALCSRIYDKQLPDSVVCAGGEYGQSTCVGDSGGPLLKAGGGSAGDTVVGVTSFGSRPCGQGAPSGYTRIAFFRPWIDKTLAKWGQKPRG